MTPRYKDDLQMPDWQREFGADYAVPAEVTAAGLIDQSWHNDVCPSFSTEASAATAGKDEGFDIRLWVDHPEASLRECQPVSRFRVCDDYNVLWEGEDPAEAVRQIQRFASPAVIMARAFDKFLHRDLTAHEYIRVIAANARETDPAICHSHDFLDANLTMAEAFAFVQGRDPEVSSDADGALMDQAWAAWKSKTLARPFTPEA